MVFEDCSVPTYEYKPGKVNEAADALSQAPVLDEVTLDGKVLYIVTAIPEEKLIERICKQQKTRRYLILTI